MSFSRFWFLALISLGACTTSQSMHDSSFTDQAAVPVMRHSLREMQHYDNYSMVRIINKELNMRESDEDAFLHNAASVLEQTVFVQPHFTEREAGIREIKSKLDQEDYIYLLQVSTDDLLSIAKTSAAPADQATVLVALQNLVIEMKTLKREELKASLKKIADANIEVSSQAQEYANEPMKQLVSPSQEAQLALQNRPN